VERSLVVNDCFPRGKADDQDRVIAACTRILNDRGESQVNRATAYTNRGNVWGDKGDHDRAIDQNPAPQAAGCGNIYKEKALGARTDRPELAKLIRRLEPDDVLVVTRLDRLARSTRDLLNILDAVGKAGAGFKSLKDTWADTTTPHGRLMLTVLGGLAEFERELIRARTDDGRKRAKARGVKFGRPVKLTAHQRKEAIQRLAEGAVQADLARSYGVSQATISRLAAPSPFGVSPAGVLSTRSARVGSEGR
jgi:DNA invertase Pin-like site-specific DNA recombinase